MKPKPKPEPAANNGYEEDEEQAKGVVASLPTIDSIDDDHTQRQALDLLSEAYEVKLRHDRDTRRLKEITRDLVVITRGFQLPGLRHGRIGLVYKGERSIPHLDKGLLLEHGVAPEVLNDCYSPSKPFSDARFYIVKG